MTVLKIFVYFSFLQVQQLAYRPNLSTRALYNCIIFLNQLKLVKEDESEEQNDKETSKNNGKAKSETSLPASLINTYFQIFEVAVNNSKKDTGKKKSKESSTKSDLAMKGRLLGALLTGVNRAHPYLPTRDIGMEKHVDSLYKIAHVSPPSACTQALMLLFHLAVGSSSDDIDGEDKQNITKVDAKVVTTRKDRFYRVLYAKLADPSMFAGRQLTLFFNLVYKSMKYDDNSVRVVACAKRLLHVAFHQVPSVVSGALFLVSEILKHQPLLQNSIFSNDGHGSIFDPTKREPSASFASVTEQKIDDTIENEESPGAAAASLWELALTVFHYHPTVSKFSSSIHEINYTGDPLRDFGLVPFLDKFAFKNPKSAKKISEKLRRGDSIGERRSGLQGNIQALSSLPVNDPNFWNKGSSVSEQDDFFQKFFTERARRDDIKGIVRGNKQDGADETDALEAAEARDVDFDWDTDEEEEDFVNKLAESLIEDNSDNEVANFDDEDPDMDDWSDYDGSDAEGEDVELDSDAIDQFDDDIDGNEDDSSDSSVDENEDDIGMSFMDDEPLSDDDNNPIQKDEKKDKKKNSTFADADEYEELIMKNLMERESKSKRSLEEKEEDYEKNDNNNQSKRKKRKRSKTTKK
jgi:ribosome biogenesis protein MAK21